LTALEKLRPKRLSKNKSEYEASSDLKVSERPSLSVGGKIKGEAATEDEEKSAYSVVAYRLTISDILQIIGDLRSFGLFVKLCAITDKFTLGSSLILAT